jgi:hypothetical protein
VTITGSNFTGVTEVLFGAVPATEFKVISETEITATVPAQGAALHNVHVTTTGGGVSATVPADAYTYVAVHPTITSVSPASGTVGGGTMVMITGANFKGVTAVAFGNVAASEFTVVSETEITAISPAQAAAAHNIHVTTESGGQSASVKEDLFTYI